MRKILVVFGTRPEAIKMAPLVRELQRLSSEFECKVCLTGQHREMLDQVLQVFNLQSDFDLDVMAQNQTLIEMTCRVLSGTEEVFKVWRPDIVLVHGDTSSAFAATIAAFYNRIDVGHVEAGLRTFDLYSPWPEEGNRKSIASLAKYHFAPTDSAKQNLLREGIDESQIFVTGNTVIDALHWASDLLDDVHDKKDQLRILDLPERYTHRILVTGHRRENFGEGFRNICNALRDISEAFPTVQIVYPVHLNPSVKTPVNEMLGNVENIQLISPVDYLSFVKLMKTSYLILTDSGGIQEEAPGFGLPVLVMRENTERPEAVDAGTARLVGTDASQIFRAVSKLLKNKLEYSSMSNAVNPFGDGTAAVKISRALLSVS